MHTQVPGNRLRELREAQGVTLMDLAALCGVYPSTVKRWQDHLIPQEYMHAVAQKLEVSVPYLAGWTDDKEQESAA